MGLERAKSRFESLGRSVANAYIVDADEEPFNGQEVLRVSFQAEVHRHTDTIDAVKREDGLKQVQRNNRREFNSDKQRVLSFVEE